MSKTAIKAIHKAISDLEVMIEDLNIKATDWRNWFDEKSDRWKESEKGEEANNQITEFECAVGDLERAKEALENAKGEA
jgi:prefoldin subunit 5